MSKWHWELWDRSGNLLLDLTGRAKNRRITQSRNYPEDIYFQVGMDELEKWAAESGVDPNTLIVEGSTEVRVKRGGVYLCGGQVTYVNPVITNRSADLEVRAAGFLELFADRLTAERRVFTATEATTIYSTLITESQTGANADFGVTIGSLATVGAHDKTFKAENLKDALQRGTELFDFDFEFTYDKVFNTYAQLGSQRAEIVFEYPGNVRGLSAPKDATQIRNRIYVQGSGAGEEGSARIQVDDVDSQINYGVREHKLNISDVEDTTALTNHGNLELQAFAFPFQIPTLEVDGNLEPYVTDYGIGDYVTVRCKHYRLLSNINGMFRVDKREISIDEEDKEDVKLYLSL